MAKQNNCYIVGMRDGSTIMLSASKLSEAQNIARRMGEAMTVQRVFKNEESVSGRVHIL